MINMKLSSDPATCARQIKALAALVETGAVTDVSYTFGKSLSSTGFPLDARATVCNGVGQPTVEEAWKLANTEPAKITRYDIDGPLTPQGIIDARQHHANLASMPPNFMFITSQFWSDIVGSIAEWGNLFDPVTLYSDIREGKLGTLLGIQVYTDGFMDPAERFLSPESQSNPRVLYLASIPTAKKS